MMDLMDTLSTDKKYNQGTLPEQVKNRKSETFKQFKTL